MKSRLTVLVVLAAIALASGSPVDGKWDESPVNQELVDLINSKGLFRAKLYDQFKGLNMEQLRRAAGASNPNPNKKRRRTAKSPNRHDDIKADNQDRFDVGDKWPQCNSTFEDIFPQGNCSASYAFAVASSISDRLCILTNQAAPRSAYDIISCCDDCKALGGNGCDGTGDHYDAFQFFDDYGIVTGDKYKTRAGCVPYPISPKITDAQPSRTQCQLRCTNPSYTNNTYSADKVKSSRPFKVFTLDNENIKNEIRARGPVVAEFDLYADFLVYDGGIYTHTAGDKVGKQYAKIIGWGVDEKGIAYWRGVASFAAVWGEHGTFKIAVEKNDELGFNSAVIAGYP